jgi:fatty-acyl-CoA synthase
MYISGGENVYPAEIEAALRLCDGVADAAVAGVPDARWGEVGAAFVQLAPGARLSPEDIRKHCSTRLARYKQPVHVRFVDALPRTGSGKVLKNRLLEGLHSL